MTQPGGAAAKLPSTDVSDYVQHREPSWMPPVTDQAAAPQARTSVQVLQQPIQHAYFNGFELTTSLSDVGMLLMIDGFPTLRLSMSFTTAKTLKENISQLIDAFETATGHTILVMNDVAERTDRYRRGNQP